MYRVYPVNWKKNRKILKKSSIRTIAYKQFCKIKNKIKMNEKGTTFGLYSLIYDERKRQGNVFRNGKSQNPENGESQMSLAYCYGGKHSKFIHKKTEFTTIVVSL